MIDIHIADTFEEIEAVARFRYSIYVQEIGIYRDHADHVGRRLLDPEDAHSWIAYGVSGGQIVGTTRLTWGGGAGFSDRHVAQYGITPFLAELPAEQLAVGERHMIAPNWRGTDLFPHLTAALQTLTQRHGVRVVFGACEPHLLSYYLRHQRPRGTRNINSHDGGYLIPLVSFLPNADALIDQGRMPGMPRCVQTVLDTETTVRSPLLGDPQTYWAELHDSLSRIDAPVFAGLNEREVGHCVAGSNIIKCARGDRLINKDGAARNVYLVLSGTLQVSDGDRRIAVLERGDIVGEGAYLRRRARSHNVDVLTDDTTVLSLSEHTLRNLSRDHPTTAAKVLENVSTILCARLERTG